jgi:hypothetical protein
MNISKFFKQEKKVKVIRDVAVKSLYKIIADYSDWYEYKGLHLPPDYATDPSLWTLNLQKIKRAFELLHDEMNGEGELWEAKNKWKNFGEQDTEKIEELNKEIIEGFTEFGKQLFYLTDPKKR